MFNWWKKKQEQQQEESDIPLRYKTIQHIITGEWAVWDTEKQKAFDLCLMTEYWWDSSSWFYKNTWTDDKELVENVVKALNETRHLWR